MDKNLLLDRTSTVDRCYATDFQFSLYFPKPWTTAPRILVDAEAPEAFRPKKPYDPFPVDIFCVGTIYITMVKALQIVRVRYTDLFLIDLILVAARLVGLHLTNWNISLSQCGKTIPNSDLQSMSSKKIFKN